MKDLLRRIHQHELNDLSAVIAYYFLLSLFPLLIFLIALFPYFSLNVSPLLTWIEHYVPSETAELLTRQIASLFGETNSYILSFGLIAALWSASNATHILIRAFNRALEIKETRPFFKVRIDALLLAAGLIITITIALVLPVFGKVIIDSVTRFAPFLENLNLILNQARWILSFFMINLVLLALYYFAPNEKLGFFDIYFGSLLATTLWHISSYGFSYYIENFKGFNAAYGSLGGIIILLIWLYFTAFSILLGGEINAMRVCRRKKKFCPD
ncbi:YihY/virulence factor BrkB family protein [Metabacillus idriensis]|uniref:YihY/virulence factor BrkB family protein n=1 Tax=Metabacillus idriensis TaxID=324768 RepID=UPI00174DBFA9|nr:YihY/virulence factor BrkB family protein [Metabacillus idriensis]